jgi:hypothetical protein
MFSLPKEVPLFQRFGSVIFEGIDKFITEKVDPGLLAMVSFEGEVVTFRGPVKLPSNRTLEQIFDNIADA